jgi:hypothetical protein
MCFPKTEPIDGKIHTNHRKESIQSDGVEFYSQL